MRKFEKDYRINEGDDVLVKENAIHQDMDLRLDNVEQGVAAYRVGQRDDIEAILASLEQTFGQLAAEMRGLLDQASGGLSADIIVETATRTFWTAAKAAALKADLLGGVDPAGDTLGKLYALVLSRADAAAVAAAIAGIRGTADAAHDTLGELQVLVDANTAAVATKADAAAIATAIAGKADRDAVVSLDAWMSEVIEQAEINGRAFGTVNGFFDPFSEPSFINTADSLNANLSGGLLLNQATDTSTKALLHFDTDFTDAAGHTCTASGSVQISTAQKVFGAGAVYFPSAGAYLTSVSSDYVVGTGDFTDRFRIYFPSSVPTQAIVLDTRPGGAGAGYAIIFNNGKLQVYDGVAGAYVITGTATVAANTWYDIQVSRGSGTLKTFVGGVADGSVANTSNFTSQQIRLGVSGNGSDGQFLGYLDEYRRRNVADNGNAAYTPATSAFTYGTSGNLLLRSTAVKMAAGAPNRAMMLAIVKATAGAINLNTNLIGSVSRNAGGAFKPLTLSALGPSASSFTIYRSPWTDITDQPVSDMLAGKLITNDPALGIAARAWAVLAAA